MDSDASPQPPPEAAPAAAGQPEPAEAVYKTKVVEFLGRPAPIVLQNDNGPCPLLAICNVLLLKNVINLSLEASEVSQQKLLSLVAERLIDSNSNVQDKDDGYVSNQEQNIADAIDLLPRLATGIDVNVLFRKINDFEFTRECAIFDLLDIPLYHGWIVDPQDTETAAAIGSKSYNTLAPELVAFKTRKTTGENKPVEEEETVDFAAATTAALGVPSPSVSRGRSFDENTVSDPVDQRMRRGDIEEEEELMRVLNLSKVEVSNTVNGSVPSGVSQSYSFSNMEERSHIESFGSETPDLAGSNNKEEPIDSSLSDGPLLQKTNDVTNIGDAVFEESLGALTSAGSKDNENPDALTKQLDVPVQSSGSNIKDFSNESSAPMDQPIFPAVDQNSTEACGKHADEQIHGESTDIVVGNESATIASQGTSSHATTDLAGTNKVLDDPKVVSSSLQGSEPIYQGEEHILDSRLLAYQSPEPVYEGEMVLAEQAGKTKSTLCPEDAAAQHQWELIDNFLQNTANQLTVYGLFCLQEGLKERELCVFFRNNHFSTMFKYNGELYILATDQGFINQPDLVWEKLDEVNGDGVFMTSNFKPFKAENRNNDSWNEQQAMTNTADYLAHLDSSALSHSTANSDLQLAIALQQQEFDERPQRYPQQQSQQQQQPPVPTPPQQQVHHSSGTGRPGLVVGPRRSNVPPPSRSESKREKCSVM